MNDILVKIGADITDFSRKMAESNRALSDFGKANAETFDAFKKTGAAVTAAGTGIALGLGAAVKTAANFEQSMSNVKAISGATGGDFDKLREKAVEMGNATMFSASESADALANLAQMGWKTDEMLDGIEHTLSLAAAGGIELAESAMITANTMNQFGLDAAEAERIADVFALTASSAGTDVIEMGDAMQYAGANASAAGMSIEDTAAFIGVLGDAGITGSKAGTSLNAMLRDLKKNSEDGAIAVGEQSIALYDAEGNMRNMPDVIGEIIKATETMSDEQRDAALSAILGDQALVGFNAIASKGADSVSNLAGELYDSKGAAKDMAEIMKDNLLGSLTELNSAFEGVMIAIGTALIPAIQKVAEWLKSLADWFNGLSEKTKSTIAVVAALSSVFMLIIGPLLMLIGFIPQIIAGFAVVKTVVMAVAGAFSFLLSPVGLIIAAIVGVIAILVLMYNKLEWFREMVQEAWEWIKEAFVTALDFIKEIVDQVITAVVDFVGEQLDKLKAFWDENGADIMEIVKRAFQAIQDVIKTVMGIIKGVFEVVWPIITNVVKTAWTLIKGIIDVAINLVLGIIQTVLKLLKGDWKGAWQTIKDTAKNMMDSIVNTFKNIDLLQVGKDIINGLIKGITSMGGAIKDGVMSLANKLPGWVKGPLGIASPSRVFMALGRFTGEGLAVGINDMTGDVRKATEHLTDAAIPEKKALDLSYATPNGVKSTLASAVRGTVDINSRDDYIAGAIDHLADKLENLRIEMDGREFGRAVSDVTASEYNGAVRGGGRRRI